MKSSPYLETFTRVAQYKAQKLLKLRNIIKVTDGEYKALPIYGYNSTTYTIREIMGKFTCNCQMGRKSKRCSHILAVYLFIERTEGIGERQLQFC